MTDHVHAWVSHASGLLTCECGKSLRPIETEKMEQIMSEKIPAPELSEAELAEVERFGIHDEMTQNWKAFIVNIEGPDDIEDFDTMREAVDHANELNLLFTEIIAGGGEFAPHMWAVPWRTAVYLSQFPRENHV